MEEKILVYKGTDKDMRCHGGFRYELGKTVTDDDAIRCGNRGFHSCEVPLNVLEYFPLQNGNRYFSGEAGGKVDRTGARDSKLAASELTLKAEIGLPGLIEAQMEYVRKKCENATERNASGESGNAAASGESGNAAASGWRGNAAASGERGNAAASGESGNAAASGESGNAAASGWSGNAAASGWSGNAAASGERGNAAASGESGNAAASGWRGAAVASGEYGSSAATGEQCIAIAWGRNGKAMGAVGCWLVLSEYYPRKDEIKNTAMVKVDGKTIKPNVWYQLKNGEVVEAE